MADPEALKMLRGGAAAWNKWHDDVIALQTRKDATIHAARGREAMYPIDLTGADLRRMSYHGFDMSIVDLDHANVSGCTFVQTRFTSASMCSVEARKTAFRSVDFTGTVCQRANFSGAAFSDLSLTGTDLRDAILTNAQLSGVTLYRCSMQGADMAGANSYQLFWGNVDLRGVKNVEAMRHSSPSSVGLDTIVQSQGDIPEVFLRGCGVPDPVIAYVASLARSAQPIQLYSCFISHSTKDHEFCRRLHNDLQAAGVRCWFAPEDLKIGDRFRDEIESAIRMHDKLLIVLSEHSVQSEWVASEVEGAFEREHRDRGRLVLFPVRLDDAVMDTPQAWAADIRRRRHIGDFSGWKDHDSYKRAFDRLVRDLRAAPSA
jgi:hypothetical protein